MPRYKWEYPSDWLSDQINDAVADSDIWKLRSIINGLLSKVDEDSIQDAFQSDMERDEYFIDQDEPTGWAEG